MKIGDFGLVTAAEEKCLDEGYASNAALATKHTNQVGTTLYMSPEQVLFTEGEHAVIAFEDMYVD